MIDQALQVSMLDGFSISLGQRRVGDFTGHSKMVWLLIAYLICQRGRCVPQEELAGILWEGAGRSANPKNAMKTAFFRARSTLDQLYQGAGRQLILRQDDGYMWNPQPPLDLDLDRFNALCASHSPSPFSDWLQALGMFGQGFIPKLRNFPWAQNMSAKYMQSYLETLRRALDHLEAQRDWQRMASLCSAAVRVAPLEEAPYRRWMSALMSLGENRAAAQIFEDMNQLFFEKTGKRPGDDSQALYRKAVSEVNDQTVPPAAILEQLREERDVGAFFCDYDIFRALYRLTARDAERTGEKACLGVISVTGRDGGELARRSLDLVMENLRKLAPGLLRQGDAMAKCSMSQYVVLLRRAGFEDGERVCMRIQKAFQRQYPHSPAKLRVTVCLMESSEPK